MRLPLPIQMVAGDTLPQLIITCQLRNELGVLEPQNIAGYTLTITVTRPGEYTRLVRTASIVDAANGKAVFAWQPDDWKEGAGQKAYITAVDSQSNRRSFGEFLFNVATTT